MEQTEQPQAGTPVTPAPSGTTETPVVQATTPTTPPATAAAGKVEDLPEWARTAIHELRAEAAKNRTAAKKAEQDAAERDRKTAEEQGKFKELYEAEKAKAVELEAKVRGAELDALRRTVAEKVGLPAKLAGRIHGENEAEMMDDAKDMLAALPPKPPSMVSNDATNGKGSPNGAAMIGGKTVEQAGEWLGVDPKFLTK